MRESLTSVSSVTVTGLRGGIPSHLIVQAKGNLCKLGEGLITGKEAPPRAKLPNISIVGGEAGTRHTRM